MCGGTVYCSPKYNQDFIHYFENFLSRIVVDFDFFSCDLNSLSLIDSIYVTQRVCGPTPERGDKH